MRVLVMVPPTMLDVSLSLSFRRRFLLALDEVRQLEAAAAAAAAEEEAAAERSRQLVWPDPEDRVTVTLVEEGLGERRSLVEGGSKTKAP